MRKPAIHAWTSEDLADLTWLEWLNLWWVTSRLRKVVRYFTRYERMLRWQFARARELGCDVYCCEHDTDWRLCYRLHDEDD